MNPYNRQDSPYPGVASHIPVLFTVTNYSGVGDPGKEIRYVHEFGAGKYSTKYLNWWCNKEQVSLSSWENNPEWNPVAKYNGITGGGFTADFAFGVQPDSIVFIDCEAELRAPLLRNLYVNRVRLPPESGLVVVIHDTEPLNNKAYHIRRDIASWPVGWEILCPFTGIQTSVVADGITLKRAKTYETLFDALDGNESAHHLRFNLASISCGGF